MNNLHRQHYSMIFNSVYRAFKLFIILIIFNYFRNNNLLEIQDSQTFWIGLVIILLTIIKDLYSYFTTFLQIEENHIVVEQKGLFHKINNIYFEDIQNINTKGNFILNAYGVQFMKMYTTSKTFTFKSMKTKDVDHIKAIVHQNSSSDDVKNDQSEVETEETAVAMTDVSAADLIYQLNKKDIFILSITSTSLFNVLALMAGAYGILELTNTVGIVQTLLNQSFLYLFLIIILFWGISIFINLLKYANYTIHLQDDEHLIIKKGMFTFDERKINIKQVSSVVVKRNFVRRLIGKTSIMITNSSAGDREDNTLLLVPIMDYDSVLPLLNVIFKDMELDITNERDMYKNKGNQFPLLIIKPLLTFVLLLSILFITFNINIQVKMISLAVVLILFFIITLTYHGKYKKNRLIFDKYLYAFQYGWLFNSNEYFLHNKHVLTIQYKEHAFLKSRYKVTIYTAKGEEEKAINMQCLEMEQISDIKTKFGDIL